MVVMNMSDTIITYETAVLAKSKGFDIPTIDYFKQDAGYMVIPGTSEKHERGKWVEEGLIISDDYYNQILTLEDFKSDWNNVEIDEQCKKYYYLDLISRPTQTILAKWLRVNHNIHINIRHEEYFYRVNYKYFHFDISHGVFTDVTKNQDLFSDLMEECSQDIPGNYVNDEKFSKLIFERNFAFNTYEECFEYALQEALKLI